MSVSSIPVPSSSSSSPSYVVVVEPTPVSVVRKLAIPYVNLVKANDLLSKNFLSGGTFTITSEAKTATSSISASSTVIGSSFIQSFTPKYEWKDKNMSVEGRVSTSNLMSAKINFNDFVTQGLSVYLRGEKAKTKETTTPNIFDFSATAGFLFNNDRFHLNGECKLPCTEPISILGTMSVQPSDNLAFGLKVEHELKKESIPNLEGKLVFGSPLVEGSLFAMYPSNVIGASLLQLIQPNFNWATRASLDLTGKQRPTWEVAGTFQLNTSSTVKGKATIAIDNVKNHEIRFALGTQQKINPNVTAIISTDINVNQALLGWDSIGVASSGGFELILNP